MRIEVKTGYNLKLTVRYQEKRYFDSHWRGNMLTWIIVSGLTSLIGGLLVYGISGTVNVDFLVPFAAGNFLYIGAADLILEIKKSSDVRGNVSTFVAFFCGLAVLLAMRFCFPHGH